MRMVHDDMDYNDAMMQNDAEVIFLSEVSSLHSRKVRGQILAFLKLKLEVR